MSESRLRDFKHSAGVLEPFGVRTVKHWKIGIDDRLKVEPSTGPLVDNGSPAQSSFDGIGVCVIN